MGRTGDTGDTDGLDPVEPDPEFTSRPSPCASCPYRVDVASGVWHAEEYAKLASYDGETFDQRPTLFACHNDAGRDRPRLCAGWLACHGPGELLAVRIGLVEGAVDPAVLEFTTDVPVFTCGADAAAHGLADVDDPSPRAVAVAANVQARRTAQPARTGDG